MGCYESQEPKTEVVEKSYVESVAEMSVEGETTKL